MCRAVCLDDDSPRLPQPQNAKRQHQTKNARTKASWPLWHIHYIRLHFIWSVLLPRMPHRQQQKRDRSPSISSGSEYEPDPRQLTVDDGYMLDAPSDGECALYDRHQGPVITSLTEADLAAAQKVDSDWGPSAGQVVELAFDKQSVASSSSTVTLDGESHCWYYGNQNHHWRAVCEVGGDAKAGTA